MLLAHQRVAGFRKRYGIDRLIRGQKQHTPHAASLLQHDLGMVCDVLATEGYCSYAEALAMSLEQALLANARITRRALLQNAQLEEARKRR